MNIDYDIIASFDELLAYERASIERCKTALNGKIFYDLGARNGLWTHAAFQAGVKKVIAFEKDNNMCLAMCKRFSEFGDRFEAINGKVGNGIDDLPSLTIDICQNAFVKMDIEGFEIAALNGMQNSIKRWKPDFMIEVHGGTEAKNTIIQMIREWTGREPSGENYILSHIYHLYYLPRDI